VSKYGKLKAYSVSIVIVAISGVITYFTLLSSSPVPFCLALGLMGFGSAGTSIIINIMLSDAIDYDELHTGKRRESTYHVRHCCLRSMELLISPSFAPYPLPPYLPAELNPTTCPLPSPVCVSSP
jgi:hypothetical protein